MLLADQEAEESPSDGYDTVSRRNKVDKVGSERRSRVLGEVSCSVVVRRRWLNASESLSVGTFEGEDYD